MYRCSFLCLDALEKLATTEMPSLIAIFVLRFEIFTICANRISFNYMHWSACGFKFSSIKVWRRTIRDNLVFRAIAGGSVQLEMRISRYTVAKDYIES